MKPTFALLGALALAPLAACTTTTTNGTTTTALSPTLVQDGNLAVAALQALGNDAMLLGAPAADATAIGLATTALQTGLFDLQKGVKTPQDFAMLFNDEVNQLAPTVLRDMKANATITTGVALLESFVTIIAADVTPASTAPTAASIDTRARLAAWISQKPK